MHLLYDSLVIADLHSLLTKTKSYYTAICPLAHQQPHACCVYEFSWWATLQGWPTQEGLAIWLCDMMLSSSSVFGWCFQLF